MNILITGATSFIGVHLIKECLKNDCNITAIVRPNSVNIGRLPINDKVKIVEIEMKDIENLLLYRDIQVDVFYHLAWEGARNPYRNDVTIQTRNYEWTLKAMEIAIRLGCKVFIGAGSQAEYGKCYGKIDETYQTNPITEYGKFKLKAYIKLKELAEHNNIRFIWTRIFSVFGIYDYSGTLIMSVLAKLLRNESIPLTECMQMWDYIYVEDVARIMYLLGDSECVGGVYNIASGLARKLCDFVVEMKEITHSISELHFGEIPSESGNNIGFEPMVEKLKNNIGMYEITSFEDGIKNIIEHYFKTNYIKAEGE